MNKNISKKMILLSGFLFLSFSGTAKATDYFCPPAASVRCVPADSTMGAWIANGGQMTGNTYAPNNQCANVISLSSDTKRLLCCYTKCGVFIQDVKAQTCVKVSEFRFVCRDPRVNPIIR